MEQIGKALDCRLLSTRRIEDCRGWFQVAFCADDLRAMGMDFGAVCQLNHSFTDHAGVVRGLNYQAAPFAQAKIIRCVRGSLYSVGADIDRNSEHFGKWCGFVLSAGGHNLMYVPRGYAHGFISLEDHTELEYFTDNQYSFEHARSVRYDDPDLGIDWTLGGKIQVRRDILSEKNRKAPCLREL